MRNFKYIGVLAGITTALTNAAQLRNDPWQRRVPDDETIERKFFRRPGPGRNQRKRRKYGRQNPSSKYAK